MQSPLNLLILTQSISVRPFDALVSELRQLLPVGNVGFYVSDLRHYRRFLQERPTFEHDVEVVGKEWEIVARSAAGRPDIDRLRAYERRVGDPLLWNALVADRRVTLGRSATLHQDYAPRFTHTRMLRILEEGLLAIEALFDQLNPSAVISFECVTFGEYLAYLFARSRRIPVLNLRKARIENYITYGTSIFEPAERIVAAYERRRSQPLEDEWSDRARHYIEELRASYGRYEGVIPPSQLPHRPTLPSLDLPTRVTIVLRAAFEHYFGGLKVDDHLPDLLGGIFIRRWLRPVRARLMNWQLRSSFIRSVDLPLLDYAFYPMHHEPEVSLLVYARPYRNQIEVIRNFASALPVGMKLVVKEHPVSIGRRSLHYYHKVAEIPNVCWADPSMETKELIASAKAILTISGSVGVEAALRRKPVLALGQTSFDFLPRTMVRRVRSLDDLPSQLRDLLDCYHCDEQALIDFVAATTEQSVPVNLYSTLLGRRDVHVPQGRDATTTSRWARDVAALAHYTSRVLGELLNQTEVHQRVPAS